MRLTTHRSLISEEYGERVDIFQSGQSGATVARSRPGVDEISARSFERERTATLPETSYGRLKSRSLSDNNRLSPCVSRLIDRLKIPTGIGSLHKSYINYIIEQISKKDSLKDLSKTSILSCDDGTMIDNADKEIINLFHDSRISIFILLCSSVQIPA